MIRLRFLFAITLAAAILIERTAATRPNVLFIVADDLRASLGCYGGPIMSPNIDQLAARSAVFTNAFVQQAVCGPSRVSFLTGRRPDTTKLYDFGSYWRTHAGNYTTLPQHFKENGYFAASVGKVFQPDITSNYTDDYPYSWSVPAYHPSTEKYIFAKVCRNVDGSLGNNVVCPVDVSKMPEQSLPDLQTFDRAQEILKNLSASRKLARDHNDILQADPSVQQEPFFLAVGFRKPHLNWKYPEEFRDLYPLESVDIAPNRQIPAKMPSVAWEDFFTARQRDDMQAMNLSFPYGLIPDEHHALMRQSYYAASSFVDYKVGQLLQALEEAGFANNTIISFIGDHGWQLGEHGEWCKYSNFEVATRVPLIVHVPNVTDAGQWQSRGSKKFPLQDPFELQARTREQFHRSKKYPLKDAFDLQKKSTTGRFNNNSLKTSRKGQSAGKGAQENVQTLRSDGKGIVIKELVELVDLFPSLSEIAGLKVPPTCPPKPFNVEFCTEGNSFVPLIQASSNHHSRGDSLNQTQSDSTTRVNSLKQAQINSSSGVDPLSRAESQDTNVGAAKIVRWKNATFSQYPRPGVKPNVYTDLPNLAIITVMGYSMLTAEHHYTEWVGFNGTTVEADWSDVKARELYLRGADPLEDDNVADESQYKDLVAELGQRLRNGWRYCQPVMH